MSRMMPWLKLFRIVNLPTVPGDVLVGASAVAAFHSVGTGSSPCAALVSAVLASCALYLFGLADNDIVGAKTDGPGRPIPAGEISLAAARIARGLCLFAAMALGALANLRPAWWVAAFLLAVAIVVYNRTKGCSLMGLCRGINVICGGAVLLGDGTHGEQMLARGILVGVAAVWILYIAAVTKYSEGEERDPAKRRRVGFLIGALVYLQLLALLAAYCSAPGAFTRGTLIAGAAMLVALRLLKRTLSKVSAS